jgi:hypothetical protein
MSKWEIIICASVIVEITEDEMTNHPQKQSASPNRRTIILRGIACVAAGGALIGAAGSANAGKMIQSVASYQTSPKGDQKCDNCLLFQAPAACQVVDGTISPAGWCKFWAKKPG